MAKRRRNGAYPPDQGLMISVMPSSTIEKLRGMPQLAQLGQYMYGPDMSSDQAAVLFDGILSILMEDITETNAAVVRQAMAEARQRYAAENQGLKDELTAALAQAEAAEVRARRAEQENNRILAAIKQLCPPKDFLSQVHAAAKNFSTPGDELHTLMGEAGDFLTSVRSTLRSFLPTGGE